MPTCRIRSKARECPPELVHALEGLPTAAVSDAMGRSGAAVGLLPLSPPAGPARTLVGPALTVKTRPGDNLVLHKAVDIASPGDVLVVDAGGSLDRAMAGEVLCRYATARGVAGLVVDGAVRDAADLATGALAVFCRGVTPVGPYKDGPGELRGDIVAGGMTVHDGDLVVGDGDGIVIVPFDGAAEVARSARGLVAKEIASMTAVDDGTLDRSWLDDALEMEWVS